jgi:hypothetical protein
MASKKIPLVDEWKPKPEQILFTNSKNIIVAPLTKFFKVKDGNNSIDYFMINTKKSYNSTLLRDHVCLYMNYFCEYFDPEKEYYTNLANLKFMVDFYPEYNYNNLISDIQRYILQPSIFEKVKAMVDYNYELELAYKSANNPQLQYTNEHGKIMMQISILMNMLIPLITHFAYLKSVPKINDFLLDIYDHILYAPIFNGVDIYAKIYETAISNITRNEKNNAGIWAKQDIRGKDTVTHSKDAVENILINIMPKYIFKENMISLDYSSIQRSNKFQITDISYEYSYISLSSSKRDGEDNTSEFDKYEANLTKSDESLFLQSKINSQSVMQTIERKFGPFDEKEIDFFIKQLRGENGGDVVNGFQRQLIFNLFYKYFGDTISINAINVRDYVKLMLAARGMLKDNMMAYLPYIISSKVVKIVSRKALNKKEFLEMESSQYYPLIQEKYKNDKIKQQILGTIATLITSTFLVIDYNNPDINGKQIVVESKIIIEEALLYILLI